MDLPPPLRDDQAVKGASIEPAETPPLFQARGGAFSPRLLGGGIFVLLLACVFGKDVVSLIRHAAESEIHSHIILIPFISAYLIYIQWARTPRLYVTSWLRGVLAGLTGVASLVAGRSLRAMAAPISINNYLSFVALSLVLFVIAGGFLFLGRSWMRSVAFAVAFLFFAIPLPDQLVDILETGSKLASAEVANAFFNLSGTPIFREGLIFQIPGITIEVAQECSGIRSSWVLFITSCLASHMFLRRPWRRMVLVLFVIPLGFLRNGFRILVIGLLCVHLGPEMINSVIHKRGGPLFFALSLIPLFLLLRWLRRGDKRLADA